MEQKMKMGVIESRKKKEYGQKNTTERVVRP